MNAIEKKLTHFFAEYQQGREDQWVCWDGVTLSRWQSLNSTPEHVRTLCLTSELGCVIGENAHLTVSEFLNNDY